MKIILGWVENIVGKGENAGYQHFLPFLQCFQKVSFSGSLKVGFVWLRVEPFISHELKTFSQINIKTKSQNLYHAKQDVFVKHECHFLRNVTFIFDLDLCR